MTEFSSSRKRTFEESVPDSVIPRRMEMNTHGFLALVFFLLTVLCAPLPAVQDTPQEQPILRSEPLRYTLIQTDAEGETHFSDQEMSYRLIDYAPPAPPISVTEAIQAENVSFLSSPLGWYGEWHPAPSRQFIFILTGTLEVEVSDGKVRRFGPGSVILLEDTAGRGHTSRVVSDERVCCVAVPLKEKEAR